MNIKSCEKNEKNVAEIVIEVNKEELESAIVKAYNKSRNSISVPGFRKGKAPRKIIEKMYGDSIFHSDALDILLPSVLKIVAEESELRIVGFPQATDVDFKEGNDGVDITITASVYPEVALGEYKGLSAVKPVADVSDSEIDSEIEGMRLRNARIEKAERPAVNGDIAVIDFEGFIDDEAFDGGKGENYELELGSNTFIPGFEEKIQGMAAGEERDLDLVFPDNYAEELAGKAVVFKVKLHEVKEKILPELDDEFAKDVSEFDTLDEYKADIKENFMKSRQTDADIAFENALMDKLIESLDADIPDAMVEEQMEISMNGFANQISSYGMDPSTYLQMMNVTPEVFRENMRTSSEKQVKIMLALEKVAELEGIEVSDEDIENEYKEGAERYEMEIDKLKDSVSEETLIRDIKIRRAAQVVTDNATAKESTEADDTKAEKPVAKPRKTAAKKPAAKQEPDDSKAEADADEKPEESAAEKPAEAEEPKPKKTTTRKPKSDKPAEDAKE